MKTKILKPNILSLKILFFSIFMMAFLPVSAQENTEKAAKEARKYMREAEAALAEDDLASAEAFYRQAIAKDPSNAEARYNLGNLYYNSEITDEAVERHSQAAKVTDQKPVKHNSFHNQGNAFMKQKKYKEAVEAYKNSLRNNPKDDETRYNLALAKKKLEEEQQSGGGGDKNQEQDQDQKQDQNQQGNKEQESDQGEPKDKQEGGDKEGEDRKEGEDEKDDKGKPQDDKNQEEKGGDQKEQPQQQQPVPGQLSPQQVKNLLEAMGNEEKKVQDKINAEKVKGGKVKTEKDW